MKIFLWLMAASFLAVSAFSQVDEAKKQLLNQISGIPVLQERLDAVSGIVNGRRPLKEKITALEAVIDRNRNDDPEDITDFLKQIGNDENQDAFIRARALKSAYQIHKNTFHFDEARATLEQAYQMQPVRNAEELDQKADMSYQIADDEWARGNYETALRGFVEFGSLYPIHSRQQLQLFAYFEVIPKLTQIIQKEQPDSTVVDELIASGLTSGNAGEVFGAAVMQYGQRNFDAALETASVAVKLNDDPRWSFYRELLDVSVSYINDEQEQMIDKLNSLATTIENDNWMTYYTRIMMVMISEFHAQEYSRAYPLLNWYVHSPIYQDFERRENVSAGAQSHILMNYAINLTYKEQNEEAFTVLENLYLTHFDQKHGKAAGLIVAEENIKQGNLERAEGIINSIMSQAELNTFIYPRSLLVLSQLKKAQGKIKEQKEVLQLLLDISDREGDEDLIRAKNDAVYFLK